MKRRLYLLAIQSKEPLDKSATELEQVDSDSSHQEFNFESLGSSSTPKKKNTQAHEQPPATVIMDESEQEYNRT